MNKLGLYITNLMLTIRDTEEKGFTRELALEQLKHLEVYLPKQLSEDEVKIIIDTIVDDLGAVSMKDMGRVMSEANKKIGSQADGKLIANIVRNKLQ